MHKGKDFSAFFGYKTLKPRERKKFGKDYFIYLHIYK
ncbi:hypothetical protein FIC_00310 [Flavobacteriaceae bacterium 3519-10]|nr:hypothetical protein FIC_00310 [Flavobacteriaceae bacterium 3519-10]